MLPLPFATLPVSAILLVLLATLVASWRRQAFADGVPGAPTACGVTSVGILLAVVAYALGRAGDATGWRNAGAALLLLTPAAAASSLRLRHGLPLVRTLIAGWAVTAALGAWLLLSLRGPGGGWGVTRVAVATLSSIVALASGVCAAAWTRRAVKGWLVVALATVVGACGGATPEEAVLAIEVRDGDRDEPMPARVELLDAAGRSWVPPDALEVTGDCGLIPFHNWFPALAEPQVARHQERSLRNPYRETEQFYVDGGAAVSVPPGDYRLLATRGPEYGVVTTRVRVEAGERRVVVLRPARWVDLPAEGWVGADDHLHIPRPHPSADAEIATWMAAEGLHVANLLQMGLARDVHITPQHGFGAAASHRHGTTLLMSGQENPRTHVFGHSIVLGAPRWIDFPAEYLLYPRFWATARELGAVNGYAHFGLGGADKGLALWGRTGLLDFLEVENFGFGFYDRWYEALNLGIRLTPTAGTDFPCVPSLPGRDRFYTYLGAPFETEAWLEAIRRGRTFVTNGPVVELSVTAHGIDHIVGEEIRAAAPGAFRVRGRVRFDPVRDRVDRLELVERGAVVQVVEGVGDEGELVLDVEWPVKVTTWLALRAGGVKLGEVRPPGLEMLEADLRHPPSRPGAEQEPFTLPGSLDAPVSAAHTSPIWIVVDGSLPLREQPTGRAAAASWASHLADVEHWLSSAELPAVAGYPGRGDGVPEELLRAHRTALLEAVAEARAWLAE